MRMDPAPPAWDTVCFQKLKVKRNPSEDERQHAKGEQEAENARRIAALAHWVLAEGLREAAVGADEFEQFMADEKQRMRADELRTLQEAVLASPGDRGRMIATALRQSPTEAFLEIVAQLLEGNAFTNRAKANKRLSIEQIAFMEERANIERLLLRVYGGTVATESAVGLRAKEVAKCIFGMTAKEAETAKEEYDDNFTKNARIRWLLLTKTIARRG